MCDVLVIGGGAAGLSASLAAGRAGAQVILAEQDFELGGGLLNDPVDGASDAWRAAVVDELRTMDNVQILTRTTAIGAYDGDVYALVERWSDHLPDTAKGHVRQRYWQVQATRTVLATGAIERPLVFGNNDLPGVMLADAVRAYLNRFAVLVGQRVVICANNDSAYRGAADLARAGAQVTLLDMRASVPPKLAQSVRDAGVTLLIGHGVLRAQGRGRVRAAQIAPIDTVGCATGPHRTIPADVIAMSGGWTPSLHLWSHRYGKPTYDDAASCFVPRAETDHSLCAVGTVAAAGSLAQTITQGFAEGQHAAEAVGRHADCGACPDTIEVGGFWQRGFDPIWAVFDAQGRTRGKAFVDF